MIDRIARRMRRKIVSFIERKRSKRITSYPFSFSLTPMFTSFVEFHTKEILFTLKGREVFEIFNITFYGLSSKKG
jgi:hypothetical protein